MPRALKLLPALLLFAAGLVLFALASRGPPDVQAPAPAPAAAVGTAAAPSYGARVGGPRDASGREIQCDLPADFHTKNVGGSDNMGLCVFCSLRHSGVWSHDPVFAGLFDWMKSRPGGGWPDKVDRMIEQYAREKGLPRPSYVQIEGLDLDLLELALQNGLMPGVTYNHSPSGRYGGGRIAHMVSLVGCVRTPAGRQWAILDNNYVTGPEHLEWLNDQELRSVDPSWAVIPLKAGPPPTPRN